MVTVFTRELTTVYFYKVVHVEVFSLAGYKILVTGTG